MDARTDGRTNESIEGLSALVSMDAGSVDDDGDSEDAYWYKTESLIKFITPCTMTLIGTSKRNFRCTGVSVFFSFEMFV